LRLKSPFPAPSLLTHKKQKGKITNKYFVFMISNNNIEKKSLIEKRLEMKCIEKKINHTFFYLK
jgi:hypothetical protein